MRKRLITPIPQDAPHLDQGWLDLDHAAVVEVTSEDKEYPVESALISGEMRGWRAADSGTQTIRLIFDEPQKLSVPRVRILLSPPRSQDCREASAETAPNAPNFAFFPSNRTGETVLPSPHVGAFPAFFSAGLTRSPVSWLHKANARRSGADNLPWPT
jgi:XRCC1 N terminal domain